jgi:RNA polymerase sigma-32 factor
MVRPQVTIRIHKEGAISVSQSTSTSSGHTRGILNVYMSQAMRHDLLTRDQEQALAERYQQTGDTEAAQRLARANLRFVVKVAHRYSHFGARLDDLVQEGNLGLLEAIHRFDASRGFRLISYAVWWIKAYIQAYLMRNWSLVRIGTSQAQRRMFFKLRRLRAEMVTTRNGEIDRAELAERLSVDESAIGAMEARLASRDASLDEPVDHDGPTTHVELIASHDPSPEAVVAKADTHKHLRKAVSQVAGQLDGREQDILERRLLSTRPDTLRTIGERHGVSRERIRQIEVGIKRQIRGALCAATGEQAARDLATPRAMA